MTTQEPLVEAEVPVDRRGAAERDLRRRDRRNRRSGRGGCRNRRRASGGRRRKRSRAKAARAAKTPKDNRNWFVVHTYSGYENKVKANLERRIHSMSMQDKIFRVLVPMEDEVEFKDGKRKITPKKVFPGYVLVEMIMDDQSWYVVRNTQGVTGFVGSPGPGEKPVPLQDKEVKTILKQMGIEAPKLKIDFKKGDRVKVTSGPFFDFTGVVDEIRAGEGAPARAHLDLRPRNPGRTRVLPGGEGLRATFRSSRRQPDARTRSTEHRGRRTAGERRVSTKEQPSWLRRS